MIVYPHIEQGTPEWKEIRKGRPTASRFSEILTAAKCELSKSADDYTLELIGEVFCPDWEYFQGNALTRSGNELEPEARDAFVVHTGLTVKQVGFVIADDQTCGCSPDGLICDADGNYVAGLEIKCPSPKEHVSCVLEGGLPNKYKQQVHGSMAVTGLNSWHFWSYFPGMMHHHCIVQRDEYTEKIASALKPFVAAYKEKMALAKAKLTYPKI